ncbi:hypothetical protein IT398_01390 [Candidatus Nomurabacteria bacterium]|nr:hypothetical protein [Candidatus Nomurabacteria bacterium]
MKYFKILVVVLFTILAGVTVVRAAWSEPACGPTGCNTPEPINVSVSSQIKDGGLGVLSNLFVGGSVGIGTSNTGGEKLVVNGTTRLQSDLFLGSFAQALHVNGSSLHINPAASGGFDNVIFNIGNQGNVGIRTWTPQAALDVAGDIKGSRLCIGSDCRDAWPGGSAPAPAAADKFGGIYSTYGLPFAGECGVPNPYTGGCSCPSGYTARDFVYSPGWGGIGSLFAPSHRSTYCFR